MSRSFGQGLGLTAPGLAGFPATVVRKSMCTFRFTCITLDKGISLLNTLHSICIPFEIPLSNVMQILCNIFKVAERVDI